MINIQKLDHELKQAEIPIHGVGFKKDGSVRIDFKDEATKAQKTEAQTILENHNPEWYVEKRKEEYPPITEQLDMLYWDKVNGTTVWKDTIQAIKDKYPKN